MLRNSHVHDNHTRCTLQRGIESVQIVKIKARKPRADIPTTVAIVNTKTTCIYIHEDTLPVVVTHEPSRSRARGCMQERRIERKERSGRERERIRFVRRSDKNHREKPKNKKKTAAAAAAASFINNIIIGLNPTVVVYGSGREVWGRTRRPSFLFIIIYARARVFSRSPAQ